MTFIREMSRDLLYFLMIVNGGAGVLIWAMGIRQSLLMANHAPEWRGLLTLRRPLASELSKPYLDHRRQMFRFMFAFVFVVLIETFLILLDRLFFRIPT